MKLTQVIQKLKSEKAISAIRWYFNSSAAKFGIGKSAIGIWAIEVSKTRNEVRARFGTPSHLSPTPKLARGLASAINALAA